MMDMLFTCGFFLFPVVVVLVMKLIGTSLFNFSIPSFVVLSLFAFTYLGIFPLYFQMDPYRVNSGVVDQQVIFQMFIYEAWSIFMLVVGFAAAKAILRHEGGFHVLDRIRPLSSMEMILIFGVFTSCVGVLLLYLSQLSRVAIFEVFNGLDFTQLATARSEMGNAFAGKYHRYSVFMHDTLNFVTFTLFAHWLVRRRPGRLVVMLLAFLAATFSAVMSLEKAPFIWLLIGMFLAYALVRMRGTFPVVTIMKLSVALVGVLLTFYMYFMSARDVETALVAILSRVTTGGVTPAYFYLEFIPEHHEFLWGRSFPNPGGIFPFDPYLLPVEVAKWKFPEIAAQGIVGSAPTVFWAELYANFGPVGVVIGPFYVGVVLYLMAFLVNKMENSPLKIGLIVWLAIHFQTLSQTGLSTFVADTYLMVVILVVLGVFAIAHGGRLGLDPKRV